ncbi:MAG: glycerophosphodiester phosphodiesterase [Myxococcota bacterium]
MHPYFDIPTPHLFGHRGASAEAPENTLPAFERAQASGVPYLEMDCHATRDGEIVILHDAEVARTTEGTGRVEGLTYTELSRLDAGYRFTPDGGRSYPFRGSGVGVPRLTEILERFPEARINLEVKAEDPEVAEQVVRIIRRFGAEARMLLAAENHETLETVRKLDPGTAIGSSREDVLAFFGAIADGSVREHKPRGQALQIPQRFMGQDLITPESIEAARALGLRVHVWTINDPDEMRELLTRGVDGLMSDSPAELMRVARAHGGAG